MTLTPFEQVLEALLEDGHKVRFTKKDGTIAMNLNSEGIVAICGVTLEQIGQLAIEGAVQCAFKRIDGAEQVCQHLWHDPKFEKEINGQVLEVCPDCSERWRGTPL